MEESSHAGVSSIPAESQDFLLEDERLIEVSSIWERYLWGRNCGIPILLVRETTEDSTRPILSHLICTFTIMLYNDTKIDLS